MITFTLQQERARILQEMGQIDQMVRGHLSQQTYRVERHGQTLTQGPYYLLQRRENGKNNCQRVAADELPIKKKFRRFWQPTSPKRRPS
jgi:hypothetical protein